MSDTIEKLKEKYYYALPISLDDSLSYTECVHSLVKYINSLIDTSIKTYDDIIAEMDNDLSVMKTNVNKALEECTEERKTQYSALEGSVTNLTAERESEDERLLKLLEDAIASIKGYYSRGFVILFDSNLGGTSDGFAQYLKENLNYRDLYIFRAPAFSAYNAKNFLSTYENEIVNKTRITDVVILTGGSDSRANGSLGELVQYINKTYTNAQLSVGYLGIPKWPNTTANGYELACRIVGANYIRDTANLCASPSLWNSNYTVFTGGETIAPNLMEAIIYKSTSYRYTRDKEIPLDTTINSYLSVTGNYLVFHEEITEQGYSYRVTSKVNITAENTLPEWLFIMSSDEFPFSTAGVALGSVDNLRASEENVFFVRGSAHNAELYGGDGTLTGYMYVQAGTLYIKMLDTPRNEPLLYISL